MLNLKAVGLDLAVNTTTFFVSSCKSFEENINSEIYTFNKLIYNLISLIMLYGKTDNIISFFVIVLFSLAFGLGLDILYNNIGKKLGIATLRFRTFHTRTFNGKLLSFLVHLSIWDTLLFHHFSLIVIGYMAFALYLAINKIFLEYAKTLKAV